MQNLKVKSEKFLANLLFVLHCALGVFVLSGWFFPRVRGIYLAVLAVWLASLFFWVIVH